MYNRMQQKAVSSLLWSLLSRTKNLDKTDPAEDGFPAACHHHVLHPETPDNTFTTASMHCHSGRQRSFQTHIQKRAFLPVSYQFGPPQGSGSARGVMQTCSIL